MSVAEQLFAITAGETYALNDINGRYILLEYSGLGISNVRRLSQRGPNQQGDTDRGFKVDPRYVNLAFGVWGSGGRSHALFELEYFRTLLYGIFRPRENDPVQLLFISPAGTKRQMDVYLEGAFDGGSRRYEGYSEQRLVARLKASDHRLYNPSQQSQTFALQSSATGWDIEETGQTTSDGWNIEETGQSTSDGWNIGGSILAQSQTIAYATGSLVADVEYPTIRIYGPISSPVIRNTTTGEKIDLSAEGGLSLLTGEYVDIDLSFDQKTILNNAGESVEQYLAEDSDLATWHLSYNTELLSDGSRSDGNNVISVTGTGVTTNTSVTISWYERYIGLD